MVCACVLALDATPIHVNNFRALLPDGRNVHEHARTRREAALVPSTVHVHFTADEEEYNLDLKLLDSIFAEGANLSFTRSASVPAVDLEPASYATKQGVFTFGNDGFVSGTVWTSAFTISVSREAGSLSTASFVAQKHESNETVPWTCGNTDGTNHHHDDAAAASGASSVEWQGNRHRRAYDQWYGNGDCYANDDTTWAANMGIAIGYQAWLEDGESNSATTAMLTAVVQTTNLVVSSDTIKKKNATAQTACHQSDQKASFLFPSSLASWITHPFSISQPFVPTP